MANPRRADTTDVTELDPPPSSATRPKLVVTHGRGGTGKSTLVRVLLERSQEAGREAALLMPIGRTQRCQHSSKTCCGPIIPMIRRCTTGWTIW
jgi:predicted alpha/beta-fold hydrolase